MPFPASLSIAGDDDPFGADTESAMRLGVLLPHAVDQPRSNATPSVRGVAKVIATGGTLLDGNEIVDRVVPDLVLRGMLEAVQQAEAAEDE